MALFFYLKTIPIYNKRPGRMIRKALRNNPEPRTVPANCLSYKTGFDRYNNSYNRIGSRENEVLHVQRK
jgi:hypothetical protein